MNVLRALTKRFEGLARVKPDGLVYPYLCPAKYATQGWGLLVADMNAPPITREEADARLEKALPYYMAQALKAVPNLVTAPPDVWEAVADFTFNLGVGRLMASTLRRKLLSQDWEGARRELPKWVYGGGRKLPGLVLRRAAEANHFPQD